jgi:hypothetical protein
MLMGMGVYTYVAEPTTRNVQVIGEFDGLLSDYITNDVPQHMV